MIGVRLRVRGDYALFTRPENKGEPSRPCRGEHHAYGCDQ